MPRRLSTASNAVPAKLASKSLRRGAGNLKSFTTLPRLSQLRLSNTYNYRPFKFPFTVPPPEEYDATQIAANMEKRHHVLGWEARNNARRREDLQRNEGTPEQVLNFEAATLLKRLRVEEEDAAETPNGEFDPENWTGRLSRLVHLEPHTQLELEIEELSSTGDGLAYAPSKGAGLIYVVPFSVPGDKVLAKTYPQKIDKTGQFWTKVDLVKLLVPSSLRKGITPRCQYFGTCSGCQLQMLPYDNQLAHKKTIVEKAFRHFSNLDPSLVPPVSETVGSPVQYGYRTKLTPHYDKPSKSQSWRQGDKPPACGFTMKNQSRVLDIETCPIGTEILNEGMKVEREKLADTFWRKKTGATVLLRENTLREMLPPTKADKLKPTTTNDTPSPTAPQPLSSLPLEYPGPPTPTTLSFPRPDLPQIKYTYPTFGDLKTYTSDHKAVTTEHIGPYTFTSSANSFFQNNNAILPTFLSFIREHILPSNAAPGISEDGATYSPKIKYLLDAYCGSGLFSIALASEFSSVLGIDIDTASIDCARENAKSNHHSQNNSGENNLGFVAADALAIFEDVPFPASQTLCIIDPPRKGASSDFLKQLCVYGAKRVVYVSCNVHTQARDVGMLVHGFGKGWRYEIERVCGFDFFPQTGHVEGVCFLNRAEEGA